MGHGVRQKTVHEGERLRDPNDLIESKRHVILSNVRGIVTELERLHTDEYIVRMHKSSADAGMVLETGTWIGFNYSDSHWSFVKQ